MNSNAFKQILLLPIYKYKEELINKINDENIKIIIIIGETGCGKTTQVPKIIYENCNMENKMICITQPRRIAAISISERVSKEMNTRIGELVGFGVRFKEKMSKKTKIKYVTDGMLIRECIIDKNFIPNQYKFPPISEKNPLIDFSKSNAQPLKPLYLQSMRSFDNNMSLFSTEQNVPNTNFSRPLIKIQNLEDKLQEIEYRNKINLQNSLINL